MARSPRDNMSSEHRALLNLKHELERLERPHTPLQPLRFCLQLGGGAGLLALAYLFHMDIVDPFMGAAYGTPERTQLAIRGALFILPAGIGLGLLITAIGGGLLTLMVRMDHNKKLAGGVSLSLPGEQGGISEVK